MTSLTETAYNMRN